MTHFKIFKNGEIISPNKMDAELCGHFKIESHPKRYLHLGGMIGSGYAQRPAFSNWVDAVTYYAGEGWEKFEEEYERIYEMPFSEIEKEDWYIEHVKPFVDYFKENQVTFETW